MPTHEKFRGLAESNLWPLFIVVGAVEPNMRWKTGAITFMLCRRWLEQTQKDVDYK